VAADPAGQYQDRPAGADPDDGQSVGVGHASLLRRRPVELSPGLHHRVETD
jgi:hypothetical protein